jgi:hypothetical protein
MVQVDPAPLEFIHGHYGGRLFIKQRSLSVRNEWRSIYRLQFSAVEGAKFLRSILPYLIVKREQAELLLMWLNLPWRARRVEQGTGARLVRYGAPTPAQREIDKKFMQAIKDCKHEVKSRMAA